MAVRRYRARKLGLPEPPMPPRTPPIYRGICATCGAEIVRKKSDGRTDRCNKCCRKELRKDEHAKRRIKRAAVPKKEYRGTCECGAEVIRFKSDGNIQRCDRCRSREMTVQFAEKNPDASRLAGRKWRANNRERANENARRYALKNREKCNRAVLDYYRRNPENYLARQKRDKRVTPKWADMKAIRAVYREARRLTKETGVRHEVDHVIPVCGRRVTGLHVHQNLQILTLTENRAKSARFDV